MGIQILYGNEEDSQGHACLFCNTTSWAFGPVFPSAKIAREFLLWCIRFHPKVELRHMSDRELGFMYSEWMEYELTKKGIEEDE